MTAYATGKPVPKMEQDQKQHQKQHQDQHVNQDVTVNIGTDGPMGDADTFSTGDTTLNGGDTSIDTNVDAGDTTFNSENNSTNVVLVPNNNTESCLRVWGLSFGNSNGAGGIGYPHRSAACDYEQAADDAAALGNHSMAWYWRCHKKNVYKPFNRPDITKAQAIEACHTKMVQFLDMGTMQQRINTLEEQKRTLLDLREHEQEVCDERVERCTQRYQEAMQK
jgi:hypothetical protein